MDDARKKLNDALVWLVFSQPLLQEFVDYIKWHEDEKILTAGVNMDHNYINIYYNPEFINGLDQDGLRFVMLHELYHVLLAHTFSRLPNPQVDNLAADMEINQQPMCVLPASLQGKAIHHNDFNLKGGESREFYYHNLMQQMEKQMKDLKCDGDCANCPINRGKDPSAGKMPCPKGKEFDDHSKWGQNENRPDIEEVWRDRVKEAVETAKARGKIPGGLEQIINARWKKNRQLGKLLKRVIGKEISASVQESSYWRRRNKRFPSYAGTREMYGPRFVLAVDTSGSMSDKDLEDVYSVIKWIKRMGYEAKLLQCDAQIADVTDLNKIKGQIKLRGRGGTSTIPVFEWIENHKYNPDMLIYFTDLYVDFPSNKPGYKVTWVNTTKGGNGQKPPFGKLLDI